MSVAAKAAPVGTQSLDAQPVRPDRRGSWIPNGRMIAAKILELRKRRGLMIALVAVDIGLPSVFLAVRLISHAVDPKQYGPAGGYNIFSGLVTGVMYVFGFIVAATLGCTAGSSDLSDGVFRHSVVTGRSRASLYFARIPAGIAIFAPIVAVGSAIVCAVSVYAAPTTLNYQGVTVPIGLSAKGFDSWAEAHYSVVFCDLPYRGNIGNLNCVNGHIVSVVSKGGSPVVTKLPPLAVLRADAVKVAEFNFVNYKNSFLYPPVSLMVESGLWVELEALMGFMIGLGLSSLIGQRTVAVILMIILEIIVTPLAARLYLAHFVNLQRAIVGLATSRFEPSALVSGLGGGGGLRDVGARALVLETRTEAVFVIVCWLVVWSALGAWRMMKRDA